MICCGCVAVYGGRAARLRAGVWSGRADVDRENCWCAVAGLRKGSMQRDSLEWLAERALGGWRQGQCMYGRCDKGQHMQRHVWTVHDEAALGGW